MYKKYVVWCRNFYKDWVCFLCMKKYDSNDPEDAIQRMYDEEGRKERANKFAKFGLVGRIIHTIIDPDCFFEKRDDGSGYSVRFI